MVDIFQCIFLISRILSYYKHKHTQVAMFHSCFVGHSVAVDFCPMPILVKQWEASSIPVISLWCKASQYADFSDKYFLFFFFHVWRRIDHLHRSCMLWWLKSSKENVLCVATNTNGSWVYIL